MHTPLILAVTAATVLATTALAQNAPDNLEKLGQFKAHPGYGACNGAAHSGVDGRHRR